MQSPTRHLNVLMMASVFSGFSTGPVLGGGFALLEQSASASANAFAGVRASVEDASTIYWNPAGTSKLAPGKQFVAAVHYIAPSIKFRDGGSTGGLNRTDFGNAGGDAGQVGWVPNVTSPWICHPL